MITSEIQAALEPRTSLTTLLRARRVLIAEDDSEMRRLLGATLRADGHEVIEAADGVELLARFEAALAAGEPVDLIISDIRMPKLTGLQALRRLRAARHHVPMILISAFSDHATHIEAWLQGAMIVFDKPFDLDELRRLIRNQRPRALDGDLPQPG
jgi:two-component system response regulator AtoC